MTTDLQDYSHKRLNILTGEWVLVSPHRAKRPWQGQNEAVNNEKRPSHDPKCYLCAGNTRINGEKNPKYEDVYIFTNDFAALQSDSPTFEVEDGLLIAQSEQGICRVICFSPDHSKSLADMEPKAIEKVVQAWQKEYKVLGEKELINYVQIFENKGAVMGCSNPHPHGQIWSQSTLPNEVDKKNTRQLNHFKKNKTSLLGDYLAQELEKQERIIYENDAFVVLVPFWAVWPFEAMIVPKHHRSNLLELQKNDQSHWHIHMSFYPALLRSASVKKFMVGYEMFGSPQRDITAESAVKMIKALIE